MQIRCGDLYADKAVEAFTACAVSDKKCVPQRVDESTFPVPPDCALDKSFDLNNFQVGGCTSGLSFAVTCLPLRTMHACPLLEAGAGYSKG
jgi:hypothetical protein